MARHVKKTYNYLERDEKPRTEFTERLPLYQPEQLIYMDKSGIDSKEISPYGYCEPGQRFHAQPPGYGKKRLSIIRGVCGKQFLAPMVDQRDCQA